MQSIIKGLSATPPKTRATPLFPREGPREIDCELLQNYNTPSIFIFMKFMKNLNINNGVDDEGSTVKIKVAGWELSVGGLLIQCC